jgi:four helix bundle protein
LNNWTCGKEVASLQLQPIRFLRKFKDYGLCNQVTRAAVSVPSNIAEGSERQTAKEFIQFLYIAKGSVAELRTQVYIAGKLNVISSADMKHLADEALEISRMLQGLITSIKKTP